MGELPSEFYHYALLVMGIGINAASIVIWWFIRSSISRAALEKAARDLAQTVLREQFESHVHRCGSEVKELQYRVGIMATQIENGGIKITIPEWKDR